MSDHITFNDKFLDCELNSVNNNIKSDNVNSNNNKGPFLYDVNKKIHFLNIPCTTVNIQLDTIKVDGFLR